MNKNTNINWNKITKLEILKIDFFIFSLLKKQLLNENIEYVDINNFLYEDIIDYDLEKSKIVKILNTELIHLIYKKDIIHQRIFYNVWFWNIDIKWIEDNDFDVVIKKCKEKWIDTSLIILKDWKDKKISKKDYYKYFLEIRINANWLRRIEELRREIFEEIKNEKIHYIVLNKIKYNIEEFRNYKWTISLIFIIIIIFLSITVDDRILERINKIPFLWSILDISSDEYKTVNVDNEYYNEMLFFLRNNNNMKDFYDDVENIKYKIQPNWERIFRLNLRNWTVKIISVKKEWDIFMINHNWNEFENISK